MEINSYIGQAIANGRKSQGITQQQLAEAMQVHQSYIANIEKGRKTISFKRLLEFCDILHLKFLIQPE